MSGKFVLILTLLLCSSYFNEVTAGNAVSANPELDEIDDRVDIRHNSGRIRLYDLPYDVLYLILGDNLGLYGLVNIAQTNSGIRSLARKIFRVRYQNGVEIKNDVYIGQYPHYQDNRMGNTLLINNPELLVAVLEQFGGEIAHLNVNNYNQLAANISEKINYHCADSLTSLSLNNIKEDTLKLFTKPFQALEWLMMKLNGAEPADNVKSFSELFPNLRQLKMRLNADRDNFSFIDHMPNLEVLEMYHGRGLKAHADALLGRNPQIKRLIVDSYQGDSVSGLDELPNIEQLSLNRFQTNKTLHFKSVKHLKLKNIQTSLLEQLSFEHLETLNVEYDEADFNQWREFIRNNPNVTKVYLLQLVPTVDMELLYSLEADLPNLKVFEMSFEDEPLEDTVNRIPIVELNEFM